MLKVFIIFFLIVLEGRWGYRQILVFNIGKKIITSQGFLDCDAV
jgi:hypothetical protein